MSFETRNEYTPKLSYFKQILFDFFQYLPPPNTIRGMICYTLLIGCISLIFRLVALLIYNYVESKSSDGIKRQIIERRKDKEIEARKMLERLNFIN